MYTQIAITNTRYNSTESGTSSYELIDDRHVIVRHLRNEQRHATFNVEMLVGFVEAYIYHKTGHLIQSKPISLRLYLEHPRYSIETREPARV